MLVFYEDKPLNEKEHIIQSLKESKHRFVFTGVSFFNPNRSNDPIYEFFAEDTKPIEEMLIQSGFYESIYRHPEFSTSHVLSLCHRIFKHAEARIWVQMVENVDNRILAQETLKEWNYFNTFFRHDQQLIWILMEQLIKKTLAKPNIDRPVIITSSITTPKQIDEIDWIQYADTEFPSWIRYIQMPIEERELIRICELSKKSHKIGLSWSMGEQILYYNIKSVGTKQSDKIPWQLATDIPKDFTLAVVQIQYTDFDMPVENDEHAEKYHAIAIFAEDPIDHKRCWYHSNTNDKIEENEQVIKWAELA